MTGNLLIIILSALQISVCISYIVKKEPGLALSWFAFALSNCGFLLHNLMSR